jgi:hypothetical protein
MTLSRKHFSFKRKAISRKFFGGADFAAAKENLAAASARRRGTTATGAAGPKDWAGGLSSSSWDNVTAAKTTEVTTYLDPTPTLRADHFKKPLEKLAASNADELLKLKGKPAGGLPTSADDATSGNPATKAAGPKPRSFLGVASDALKKLTGSKAVEKKVPTFENTLSAVKANSNAKLIANRKSIRADLSQRLAAAEKGIEWSKRFDAGAASDNMKKHRDIWHKSYIETKKNYDENKKKLYMRELEANSVKRKENFVAEKARWTSDNKERFEIEKKKIAIREAKWRTNEEIKKAAAEADVKAKIETKLKSNEKKRLATSSPKWLNILAPSKKPPLSKSSGTAVSGTDYTRHEKPVTPSYTSNPVNSVNGEAITPRADHTKHFVYNFAEKGKVGGDDIDSTIPTPNKKSPLTLETATSTVLLTSNKLKKDETDVSIENILVSKWEPLYNAINELSETDDNDYTKYKYDILRIAQQIRALAIYQIMPKS